MIRLAIIFLVIGLICGAFGFFGAESAFVGVAKILFFIAIAVFLIFLILGLLGAKKISGG